MSDRAVLPGLRYRQMRWDENTREYYEDLSWPLLNEWNVPINAWSGVKFYFFDGKDEIMQKVAQNGTMFQKLLQYMQLALSFAQVTDPMAAETIAQDILMTTGGGVPASGGAGLAQSRAIAGDRGGANAKMANARATSAEAAQPRGGRVTRKAGGR